MSVSISKADVENLIMDFLPFSPFTYLKQECATNNEQGQLLTNTSAGGSRDQETQVEKEEPASNTLLFGIARTLTLKVEITEGSSPWENAI